MPSRMYVIYTLLNEIPMKKLGTGATVTEAVNPTGTQEQLG